MASDKGKEVHSPTSPTTDIKRTAYRGSWSASLSERQGVAGSGAYQYRPQSGSFSSMEPVRTSDSGSGAAGRDSGSDSATHDSGHDMEAKPSRGHSNGVEGVTVTETAIDGLSDGQNDEKKGLLEAERHDDKASSKDNGARTTNRCLCCGLLILLLAILLALIAIAITLGVTLGKKSSSNAPLQKITLEEVFNSSFYASSYSGEWVVDDELLHFSYIEGVVLYSPADDTSRILIYPDELANLDYIVNDVSLSYTGQYLLLVANASQVFRHSFLARYYIRDVTTNSTEELVPPSGVNGLIQYAKWSPADDKIAYVVDNDIFIYDMENDETSRATSDGKINQIYNGIPDWVYEEEVFGLPYTLWWSPDGDYILYLTFNDTDVEQFNFPIYGRRENQYTQIESIAYPKAGDTNPTVTAWMLNVETLDKNQLLVPGKFSDSDHYVVIGAWANAITPMVTWMNRVQNDAIYCYYSETGGDCIEVYEQQTPDGWIELIGRPIFSDDGDNMFLIDSVATDDGDSFLNIVNITTSDKSAVPVTDGNSEVTGVLGISDTEILYISTKTHPSQRHIYSSMVSNANDGCLTCDHSMWNITDSSKDSIPSECNYWSGSCTDSLSYCLLECSGPGLPFTVIVQYADDAFIPLKYPEDNAAVLAALEPYALPDIEMEEITDDTGLPSLLARVMYPPGFRPDGSSSYPVLFYIYGGPNSQMIGDTFITYNMLMVYLSSQLDMIVVSVDGRGTGYRGNSYKWSVYRKLGILETADQNRAGRYYKNKCYTDSDRFAIYGSSYGGYMAGMAGASNGGVFTSAISQSPVTDWIYYDSIYTERYMGTPAAGDNYDGYIETSLLMRATNLSQIDYMLIHGTGDDNVHFQNTAQLVHILTENEIEFRLQFYTDEAHALSGGNTRQHLYELLTDFLSGEK